MKHRALVHLFVLTNALLLASCGSTLSDEGERVKVTTDEAIEKPRCRYLGDVTGTATWAEGARNDARNQAADLQGNRIVFVKETPEVPPSGLAGDLGVKAVSQGQVYKCVKAKAPMKNGESG